MGIWDPDPFGNDAARTLVADLRAGRFSFPTFRFNTYGGSLDADDAAVIIALGALATRPLSELPEGICEEHVTSLRTPQARAWLRRQFDRVLDTEASALYALWEDTGELQAWVDATRAVVP